MGIMASVAFLTGSPADWMIILVVALIVFGPKKLPEVGKQLGQAMREFNKMKDEFTGAVHSVRDEVESAYDTVAKPYSAVHTTSSPTVEAATQHRVYDQAPEDLMAPAVPEIQHADAAHPEAQHGDGQLLTPPPPAALTMAEEANEKGH